MAECPVCGSSSSKKQTKIAISLETNERKSGKDGTPLHLEKVAFLCDKCLSRFPIVLERRNYAIVPLKELKEIRDDLKRLDDAKTKSTEKLEKANKALKEMEGELKDSVRDSEIRKLEDRLTYLQNNVAHLKKDKEELEEKIASAAAPL
jgi:septal ring factor EnvC (AmiA/AmiB activator)